MGTFVTSYFLLCIASLVEPQITEGSLIDNPEFNRARGWDPPDKYPVTLSRLELKNFGHIFLGYGPGPSCQKAKERIDESSSGAALTTVCVPINELPSELPLPPPPPKEHYEK